MVVLPMIRAAAARPRILCPSGRLQATASAISILPRALDACFGAALCKRDIEEIAGSETCAAQHDPARAVADDAVAAPQHRRRIQVRRLAVRRAHAEPRVRAWCALRAQRATNCSEVARSLSVLGSPPAPAARGERPSSVLRRRCGWQLAESQPQLAEQLGLRPQPRVGVHQPARKVIDVLHAPLEFLAVRRARLAVSLEMLSSRSARSD